MKWMLVLFMCIILSCKKDKEAITVPPPPAGASNKIEGDIIWGGITSTHFANQAPDPTSDHAFFSLDSTLKPNYQIVITGYDKDTVITFQIRNPDFNAPGVYNFQDLDSNHFVTAGVQSGYGWGGTPPLIGYSAESSSNKGRLTIDTISEKHISGSIDTYCYREKLPGNTKDTNEVHLLIHFSGDF